VGLEQLVAAGYHEPFNVRFRRFSGVLDVWKWPFSEVRAAWRQCPFLLHFGHAW
jgi:hypothetical protein